MPNMLRCKMTTVDQETGQFSGPEPLQTLRMCVQITGGAHSNTYCRPPYDCIEFLDHFKKIHISRRVRMSLLDLGKKDAQWTV